MNEEASEHPVCIEPSVLVDQAVLTAQNGLQLLPKGKPYSINNNTFYVEDRNDEHHEQFQVHAERLTNITGNFFLGNGEDDGQFMYCSTPESDYVEDDPSTDDKELSVTIKRAPHGVVINDNVYLTTEAWNTLVVAGDLLRCCACGTAAGRTHAAGATHERALSRCRPLARFDLSVTRKIRDQYHCGVCNEVFELEDEIEHFASKSHEDNQLFAVNKVSDIDLSEYDNNENINNGNTNNDCYHFDAKAINNNNINTNVNHNGNGSNDRYFGNKFDDLEISSVEGDYEAEYDYDYNEEFPASVWGAPAGETKKSGSSYATMLKKPKILDIPMFLEKDLGNKKVKIRFDSYHMLIKPKSNRFYCMVCKEYSHIRSKAEHCMNSEHLEKLEQCAVVDKFGDFFIRVVDEKLYHCGHCNNLVLLNDMEDHIEERHPKRSHTISESAKKCANDTKNRNNDTDDARSSVDGDEAVENGINDRKNKDKDSVIDKVNSTNRYNSLRDLKDADKNANSFKVENKITNKINDKIENNNNHIVKDDGLLPKPLFIDVIISPFGYKMSIPLVSLHVILKRQHFNDFYCGLCDVIFVEAAIIPHINCVPHAAALQRTPFILPFNCNLIRAIREKMHCAICNVPISVNLIYTHIQDPSHLQLLTKALSVSVSPPIVNAPKNAQDNPQNPNNDNDSRNKVNGAVSNSTLANVTSKNKHNGTETKVTNEVNDKNKFNATEMKNTKEVKKVFGGGKDETVLTTYEKDVVTTKRNDADEMDLMLNDSFEPEELDLEDFVYIKIKNTYFKISLTSYNTLVAVGDGSRYCFVCSVKVNGEELKRHVDSRSHMDNIKDSKFMDKFDGTLIRQIFLLYHCCVCNVLISRRELKNHLSWPTHAKETAATQAVPKKSRKNDVKCGKLVHVANFAKETIYLNEKETETKILFKVRLSKKPEAPLEMKKKIVIIGGDVLKISFENWNSVCEMLKGGWKCQLCQDEFEGDEMADHVRGEAHLRSLERGVKIEYVEHLLRQINENTLHCMICNVELSDKQHIVLEHIDGKRHREAMNHIRTTSSCTNAYSDCDDDVLQL